MQCTKQYTVHTCANLALEYHVKMHGYSCASGFVVELGIMFSILAMKHAFTVLMDLQGVIITFGHLVNLPLKWGHLSFWLQDRVPISLAILSCITDKADLPRNVHIQRESGVAAARDSFVTPVWWRSL